MTVLSKSTAKNLGHLKFQRLIGNVVRSPFITINIVVLYSLLFVFFKVDCAKKLCSL